MVYSTACPSNADSKIRTAQGKGQNREEKNIKVSVITTGAGIACGPWLSNWIGEKINDTLRYIIIIVLTLAGNHNHDRDLAKLNVLHGGPLQLFDRFSSCERSMLSLFHGWDLWDCFLPLPGKIPCSEDFHSLGIGLFGFAIFLYHDHR